MQITADQAPLAAALKRAAGAVENRSTLPMLTCVLISPADGGISLTGSNMDMETTTRCAASVDRPGPAVAVNAATLTDAIARLPSGAQVRLEVEDSKMVVRSGRSRMTLPVLDGAEYPRLRTEALDTADPWQIPAAALAHLIARTEKSAGTEETRYYLCGIYLHTEEMTLYAVATDGHRLAMTSTAVPVGTPETVLRRGVILPNAAIKEIRRLLPGHDAAELTVTNGAVRISIGDTTLITKLIDGVFPDYRRVIPEPGVNTLEVDTKDLTDAIGRIWAMVKTNTDKGKSNGVRLACTPDAVTLTGDGADGFAGEEILDPERTAYAGEPLWVGFNARYMADIAEATGADRLRLAIPDAAGAMHITNASDSGDGSVFVLMPMRI